MRMILSWMITPGDGFAAVIRFLFIAGTLRNDFFNQQRKNEDLYQQQACGDCGDDTGWPCAGDEPARAWRGHGSGHADGAARPVGGDYAERG